MPSILSPLAINLSLLGESKLHVLIDQLKLTKDVDGDIAEIGVYKGGTALEISKTMPGKTLHLYDTFKGIIGADNTIDVHSNGEFSNVSLDSVKDIFGSKAVFHVGAFPGTFKEPADLKFSFIHSDTDTYFGAKETLKIFVPRMSPGGKILFDDWKWRGCPGIEKAITEFLNESPKKYSTEEIKNQFIITF